MEKQEQTIQESLQKLTERMKQLGYHEHWVRFTFEYVSQLQEKGVLAVDRLVQRLERCTKGSDKKEYWEVLMEGRFAATLAHNNFSGIEVEYCSNGPDIKATWNRNTVYFEVTRKRSLEDEWADQSEPFVRSIVASQDSIENIISKIKPKLKQLKDAEINIVVYCSSTIAVDEHDIGEAFKLIEKDPKEYEKLSGILFTNDWGVNTSTLKQFYLFKNDKASEPLGIRLSKKLKSLHEQDIKQLRQEIDELNIAFRQLRERANK